MILIFINISILGILFFYFEILGDHLGDGGVELRLSRKEGGYTSGDLVCKIAAIC